MIEIDCAIVVLDGLYHILSIIYSYQIIMKEGSLRIPETIQ